MNPTTKYFMYKLEYWTPEKRTWYHFPIFLNYCSEGKKAIGNDVIDLAIASFNGKGWFPAPLS